MDYHLRDDKLNFLILENKDYFELFIRHLNGQFHNENEWFELLDKNYNNLSFVKNADIINSPVDLRLTSTQIKKKLYQNLAEDLEMHHLLEDFQNAYIILCEGRDKGFKKLGSEAFIAETLKNVGKSNELETFMK